MSSSLHDRAVEDLGRRIISGELAPGDTVLATDLAEEMGVGRSVIREAVRVLQSLGLLESVRRLGIRVLPEENWNSFDPQLISWRLAGSERASQLRSLTQLRRAVEPAAAELAAQYADPEAAADLVALADDMRTLGRAGDVAGFLAADIRFHAGVLELSGNRMFAAMDGMVAEVLRGRTRHGLMPHHPHEDALRLHIEVAGAIAAGNGERARDAMDRIMRRTAAEVDHNLGTAPGA
ncbi:FadR/GntR family transcriptional regulator [Mycetocola spongiae]|uniref:FadR/GntR family transcriptional regulator n=1 Tax=Mycetocola spongiae TaxID=2859226 RepID=UPI001CF240F7|nr:FCD domain-containing protein [Mycetocola spongiae]UCR87982.1 FCD domain-containing protein [Mycetocola spongiae]